MTKIKICGITSIADALDAIDLGVDYLGFNFYPDSKRFVNPETFHEINEELPFNVPKVGVFVNAAPQYVIDVVTQYNLDYIQLHGDEDVAYCSQFARPIIKALRPERESDLEGLADYDAELILIDAFVSDSYGGTGVVSNWDLAKKAKNCGKPLMLSGGLTPENIEMAVGVVKPFAVDVASGVEHEPGIKSRAKMEEFVKRVRAFDESQKR